MTTLQTKPGVSGFTGLGFTGCRVSRLGFRATTRNNQSLQGLGFRVTVSGLLLGGFTSRMFGLADKELQLERLGWPSTPSEKSSYMGVLGFKV